MKTLGGRQGCEIQHLAANFGFWGCIKSQLGANLRISRRSLSVYGISVISIYSPPKFIPASVKERGFSYFATMS